MQELAAAHPDVERISWTDESICVGDPMQRDACEDTSAREQEIFEALPGSSGIVWQKKDDGFTFIRFYRNDPPMYTITRTPAGVDIAEYADDRGFRTTRDLGEGWTLLGPIPDLEQQNAQWP